MLIESQLKRLGFGTAALFLLIVAMLIGVPQMYLMTLIIALIPIVGCVVNKFLSVGLVVTRSAPPTANQRSRHPVDLVVQNDSKFPKFFLRFNDSLPRQIRYGGTTLGDPSFIPVLWPGEKATVRYFIEPVSRGMHTIGPLSVMSTDILGFTTTRKTVQLTSEVLVYPEVLPVAPVVMSTGAAIGLRDDQDARSKGSGTDFSGVREYREGDELRRINWKSTARTGTLVVTEYSQGFASDITLVLDCGKNAYANSHLGEVSAFEYAVKIAVAFGVTALGRGSHVTLLGCYDIQNGDMGQKILSGTDGVSQLLDIMARVAPMSDLNIQEMLESRRDSYDFAESSVVITPFISDDEEFRYTLLNKFAKGLSNTVQVFWLDTDSFTDLEDKMSKGIVTRSAFTPTAPGVVQSTGLGREYHVGPYTNLVALLGGLAYGG